MRGQPVLPLAPKGYSEADQVNLRRSVAEQLSKTFKTDEKIYPVGLYLKDSQTGVFLEITATSGALYFNGDLVGTDFYFDQFGAVGDGSTDDTTAINSCRAAALTAGVWARGKPGKTYKTTATLALSAGEKLDLTGVKPTSDNQINAAEYTGATLSSTTLSSSVAVGAVAISVNSATNFAIGRYALLAWTNATTGNAHHHLARITSVGATIGVAPAVPAAINSAWSNSVTVFTAGADIEVETAGGVLDMSAAGTARVITGITKANPAVVSYTGPTPVNGESYFIDGVGGMIEVNRTHATIANATASTFELSGVNSSAYTTYTSGGVARPVCHGVRLVYAANQNLDIDVTDTPGGSGVSANYCFGGRQDVRGERCGNQQEHAQELFGCTGTVVHDSENAPGAGLMLDKCTYVKATANVAFDIGADANSTGGRAVQINGSLRCRVDVGSISAVALASGLGWTALAISSGSSNNTIYCGSIVGAGTAVWLDDNYNLDNAIFGPDIAGCTNDIAVYATSTGNMFYGARYDAGKLFNAGGATFT